MGHPEPPHGLETMTACLSREGSVSGTAEVSVNGVPPPWRGEFTCQVPITSAGNAVRGRQDPNGDCTDEAVVLWDKQSFKRYRFSIDDNIQWLKDLGAHAEDYASLFDHWYLDSGGGCTKSTGRRSHEHLLPDRFVRPH